MNSIDEQQPEQNREDLSGPAAVAKIKELVNQASTCFFCTAIDQGKAVPTRPMSVQEVDDEGCLWFLSANDSHKNRELELDPAVQLLFQGSAHSDFLSLYGRAEVGYDRPRIERYWRPLLRTWFTGGKDDPRITVIRVVPISGYYWDTKHNRLITFGKMIAGAVTRKTLDDSVQGTLAL